MTGLITKPVRWFHIALVLLGFSIGLATLSIGSYAHKSPPQDEIPDLTWGYKTLKYGEFAFDMSMPPFLQEWGTIPLVLMPGVKMSLPRDGVDYHRFFYVDNDLTSLMIWVRLTAIIWGILLGILVFSWSFELYGFLIAVSTLVLFMLEPTVLGCAANARADVGTACFIFGTLYFLWRSTRQLTVANIAGMLLFCALGVISKFTTALLGPLILIFLTGRVLQRSPWSYRVIRTGEFTSRSSRVRASLVIAILLIVFSWGALWAVYGFRFNAQAATPFQTAEYTQLLQAAQGWWSPIRWFHTYRLFPDAFLNAILLQRQHMHNCLCYFWGKYSMTGWWYHFPGVFLLRTSCAVVIAFLFGVVCCLARPKIFFNKNGFFLLPAVALFSAGMLSPYQPELRDIWPIYPFVFLTVATGLEKIASCGRRWIIGVLVGASLFESVNIYPDYLTFANWFIGGAKNGWKYVQPSNADQGQDLVLLKKWMDEHHVDHIYLGYRGSADPNYYGINCLHLPPGLPYPNARMVPFESIQIASATGDYWKFNAGPEGIAWLPGYVAVSLDRVLIGPVLFGPWGAAIYGPFRQQKPVAFLGQTIFVYWVEKPWW